MRHGKNKLVFLILSLFLMMLSSCVLLSKEQMVRIPYQQKDCFQQM